MLPRFLADKNINQSTENGTHTRPRTFFLDEIEQLAFDKILTYMEYLKITLVIFARIISRKWVYLF